MIILLGPLVFLLAFCISLATIISMVAVYGDRAVAALLREHVPAAAILGADFSYRPVRDARSGVTVRTRGPLSPVRAAA